MRNVVYADYSDSGYACAICKEPIEPEEIFNDRWHCGHSAYVEDAAPTCKTTGMPCCRCQPGSCEHRGDGYGAGSRRHLKKNENFLAFNLKNRTARQENRKLRREVAMGADKCVCCGAVIPEGTQVCWRCLKTERYTSKKKKIMRKLKRLLKGWRSDKRRT